MASRGHEAELRQVVGVDLKDGGEPADDPDQPWVGKRVACIDDVRPPAQQAPRQAFAVAPSKMAAAAAHAAPAATAPAARPGETRAGPAALSPVTMTTSEPRMAAAASQRYRKSSPVLMARTNPKITGVAARSAAQSSNSWYRRESGTSIGCQTACLMKRKPSNDFPAGSASVCLACRLSPSARAASTSVVGSTKRNSDSNFRKLVNGVGVTAGLEAEGAWRMTLRTPPGLRCCGYHTGDGHGPFPRSSNIRAGVDQIRTPVAPARCRITSATPQIEFEGRSKIVRGDESRYFGLTSTTTTREVTVGLTCSNPLPVEPAKDQPTTLGRTVSRTSPSKRPSTGR